MSFTHMIQNALDPRAYTDIEKGQVVQYFADNVPYVGDVAGMVPYDDGTPIGVALNDAKGAPDQQIVEVASLGIVPVRFDADAAVGDVVYIDGSGDVVGSDDGSDAAGCWVLGVLLRDVAAGGLGVVNLSIYFAQGS